MQNKLLISKHTEQHYEYLRITFNGMKMLKHFCEQVIVFIPLKSHTYVYVSIYIENIYFDCLYF